MGYWGDIPNFPEPLTEYEFFHGHAMSHAGGRYDIAPGPGTVSITYDTNNPQRLYSVAFTVNALALSHTCEARVIITGGGLYDRTKTPVNGFGSTSFQWFYDRGFVDGHSSLVNVLKYAANGICSIEFTFPNGMTIDKTWDTKLKITNNCASTLQGWVFYYYTREKDWT